MTSSSRANVTREGLIGSRLDATSSSSDETEDPEPISGEGCSLGISYPICHSSSSLALDESETSVDISYSSSKYVGKGSGFRDRALRGVRLAEVPFDILSAYGSTQPIDQKGFRDLEVEVLDGSSITVVELNLRAGNEACRMNRSSDTALGLDAGNEACGASVDAACSFVGKP